MESRDLSSKIIKAAYDVHNELGTGFVEKVYENSLLIALRDSGLEARPQVAIDVRFRGQVVGEYYADILVEDLFVLELKAVKSLLKEHSAQLINYLKATGLKEGLLINFAAPGLDIKRAYL